MRILLIIIILNFVIMADSSYYSYGKLLKLTPIKSDRSIKGDTTYYLNDAGQKIGVKNEIIIKCKDNSQCTKILKQYNFKQIQKLTPKLTILKLHSDQDPFSISRSLHKEENIEFAHPNFIKKRYKR